MLRAFITPAHRARSVATNLSISAWLCGRSGGKPTLSSEARNVSSLNALFKLVVSFCATSSGSLAGAENRAKKVWMQEEGYDEAEALMLAEYQSQAIFFAVLGNIALFFAVWALLL